MNSPVERGRVSAYQHIPRLVLVQRLPLRGHYLEDRAVEARETILHDITLSHESTIETHGP